MELMAAADEDERGDDQVQCGHSGNYCQRTVSVRHQPDVILCDEQFERDISEPGEERRIVLTKKHRNVSQKDKADDLDGQKQDRRNARRR